MPDGLPYPLVETGTVAFDNTGDGGQTPFTKVNLALANLVQSPGEIAAGITPINYNFVPGCVDRYFTNYPAGTVSAVNAFNAAISVATLSPGRVPISYGFTAPYLLDSPVNGTLGAHGDFGGLTFINTGSVSYDWQSETSASVGIFVKHTQWAAFDFTGQDQVVWVNPCIRTHPTIYPKVGFLCARAFCHRIRHRRDERMLDRSRRKHRRLFQRCGHIQLWMGI